MLKDLLIAPALRRVGSLIAGYAAAIGANAEQTTQITLGAIALLSVGGDLLISYAHRNKLVRRVTGRGN